MSNQNGSERDTRWEGFSNYQSVSDRIARSIHDAIEAYAVIDSRHAEKARIKPGMAAQARAKILAPALRLKVEMAADRNENVDEFDEILDRWAGDDGFLEKLEEVQLQRKCPDWLSTFVEDIRSAGYELGYLQAGRTVKEKPDDPVERDTEEMFDNL
jgi:hypothetical protein